MFYLKEIFFPINTIICLFICIFSSIKVEETSGVILDLSRILEKSACCLSRYVLLNENNGETDSLSFYRMQVINICDEYVRQAGDFIYGWKHAAFRNRTT